MEWGSKSIENKLTQISGVTGILSLVLLASAATLLISHGALWVIGGLSASGGLLVLISMIIPGILSISGHPQLALAWIKGRHRFLFSNTPWEMLSKKQRLSIYAESMLSLFFAIAFIFWLISEN